MADSLQVSEQVINTTSRNGYGTGTYTVTRTNIGEFHWRGELGTSEETFTLPTDVSGAVGVVIAKNHDDTNYLELGDATSDYFCRIPPGQSIRSYGPVAATAFYGKANTAACDFELHVWAT